MSAPPLPRRGPFPILTGPTGVGKTAYSLELAERLDAEIISADSRQIYRELTIGSAKSDAAALARVPHHFVDELSLDAPYSAGAFARRANQRIHDILGRNRLPLVVGGSTLYLHALQHGLAPVPELDPNLRRALEQRLAREGAASLFAELRQVDPDSAAHLDVTKTARLVRALAVLHGTGIPLSHYHALPSPAPYTFKVVALDMERSCLYDRINDRVDRMLEQGLLDEARRLLEAGHDPSIQALQTIGYREAIAFLKERCSQTEMIRLIKRNTRRYAKRQLSWLRRYPNLEWIRLPSDSREPSEPPIHQVLAAFEPCEGVSWQRMGSGLGLG